jgi:hypothetical protein
MLGKYQRGIGDLPIAILRAALLNTISETRSIVCSTAQPVRCNSQTGACWVAATKRCFTTCTTVGGCASAGM